MTADPTPEVVHCRWCGAAHVRMFSNDQLRELVDEDARHGGGNTALAARMGVGEMSIRRLRNRIAVEAETLLRVDVYYQRNPDVPTRLRGRIEYDARRASDPQFSVAMSPGGLRILPRRAGT